MTCGALSGAKATGFNWYAMSVKEAVARTIYGATFRMSASKSQTMPFELWLANAQGRPTRRVRAGKVVLGSGFGQWSGKLRTPYRMPANTNYAIVIYPLKGMFLPSCLSGTRTTGYVFVQRVGWLPSLQNWAFQVDAGTAFKIPTLRSNIEPTIGHTMKISIANARAASVALLAFGDSNSSWGALRLPLSLSALGAPGCFLETSQVFSVVAPTGRSGAATISIPITALDKVSDEISAKVCTLIDAVSTGSVTCSTLLGISINGIRVNSRLTVGRDDCSRTSFYASNGSVQFPGGIFAGPEAKNAPASESPESGEALRASVCNEHMGSPFALCIPMWRPLPHAWSPTLSSPREDRI